MWHGGPTGKLSDDTAACTSCVVATIPIVLRSRMCIYMYLYYREYEETVKPRRGAKGGGRSSREAAANLVRDVDRVEIGPA